MTALSKWTPMSERMQRSPGREPGPKGPRYGIEWPEGTFTGAITDKHADATAYIRNAGMGGHVYLVGGPQDPEVKPNEEPA